MLNICSLKRARAVLVWLFFSVFGSLTFLSPTLAHQVQPAIVDIEFGEQGNISLSISVDLEALMAISSAMKRVKISGLPETYTDIYEAEYERLKGLGAGRLKNAFDRFSSDFLAGFSLLSDQGEILVSIARISVSDPSELGAARISTIFLEGMIPNGAKDLVWDWAADFGPSTIRIAADQNSEAYLAYLLEGQKSNPLAISGARQRSMVATILNYIGIGYVHILPLGVDHILFVVGLFLLSSRLHALVWQISAFTLAHTITLALGMTGLVSISAAIVEPLIALSIVYVCVENIFTQKLSRRRPMVVFGFGLLHGLGFAGVLREIGLPANEFVVGLISFNIGVELGQLSIIAICFLLVGFWFSRKNWYRAYIVIPASIAIGSIGGWWFVERVFFA